MKLEVCMNDDRGWKDCRGGHNSRREPYPRVHYALAYMILDVPLTRAGERFWEVASFVFFMWSLTPFYFAHALCSK